MQNMDSIQIVKEKLQIKSVELRKMTEENGKFTKKVRNLISFNQDEVGKLKAGIKTAQEETEVQRVEVNIGKRIADKMEVHEKRARSFKEKVEQEKTANKFPERT